MSIVGQHIDSVKEVAESNAFLPANGGPPGFHYRYVRVDGAEGRWGDRQKHVWLHFLFSLLLNNKNWRKNQRQKILSYFLVLCCQAH